MMSLNILDTFTHRRFVPQSVIIAAFCAVYILLTLTHPLLEWDMIAYVSNAKKMLSDMPIEQLHLNVYAELRNFVSADDYERLIGSPSRRIISEDPEAFRQTITFFYDSRIIYTSVLAGLTKLGMNPFFASYFISTMCSVISILLLATLLPRPTPYGLCLTLPFLVLAMGLLAVGRTSTPDAMATMTTIAMYWFLMRRYHVLLVLFPLSIFVRTDLILLMPIFLGYLYLDNRFARKWIIVSGIATVAAYLILNHLIVDGDAWSSLIGYNYGDKPTHPETYSFVVTLEGYISYFREGMWGFSYNPIFFIFCACAILGVYLSVPKAFNSLGFGNFQLSTDFLFAIFSCVGYFAAHFVLFPVPWTRFYAAQYSLVAVITFWAIFLLAAENRANDNGTT